MAKKRSTKKVRSNLGKVYRSKRWAKRWARGRPVVKVPGGWKITRMRKRRKKTRRKSRRKTYRKKSSAQRAAKGRPVYKVKGGWRIGKRR